MDLRVYIAPLLRWWWLILAATLAAAAGSFLSVRNQPPVYQSQATLLVGSLIDDPNPSGNQFSTGEQVAQLYTDIAHRQPVRQAVMDELGLNRLPDYNVSAPARTPLINVTVRDSNPERAQAVASALANQLVQLSPSGAGPEEEERQAFVNAQLDNLQTQIEETEAEIEAKQQELGELFSAEEINQTQTELGALQAKLNTLQSNFAALMASSAQGATNRVAIIEPASLPRAPIDPGHELTVLIAAALGFVLAAGAAYALAYLDDSIQTVSEVEHSTQLPALATIANINFEEGESRLIVHTEPRSPHAEAFRVLRTNIQYAMRHGQQKLLLITSPREGDGKSLIAANLAVTLAQTGKRVLLVDADLRRSMQDTIFQASNDRGLTHLLECVRDFAFEQQAVEAVEALTQKTELENLRILTSGELPSNPSELLGSEEMQQALSLLAKQFDHIILDSPPVLAVTDAVVLSTQLDGTFLVVKTGHTRRKELVETVKRLRAVGGNLQGVIPNHHSNVDASYYYAENYYRSEETEKPGARARAKAAVARLNGTKGKESLRRAEDGGAPITD